MTNPKQYTCRHCGGIQHNLRDCPKKLIQAGYWKFNERVWLRELVTLANECEEYKRRMIDTPKAVNLYNKLGRTFSPIKGVY